MSGRCDSSLRKRLVFKEDLCFMKSCVSENVSVSVNVGVSVNVVVSVNVNVSMKYDISGTFVLSVEGASGICWSFWDIWYFRENLFICWTINFIKY